MHSKPSEGKTVVVLGAGPAGLGAAYRLAKMGHRVLLLEKQPIVGGMGATIRYKNYLADYGPHTFHMKDSEVTALFKKLCGEEANYVLRNAKIWLDDKLLPFPLAIKDVFTKLGLYEATTIGLDFARTRLIHKMRNRNGWQPKSFEEWGIHQFGRKLYRLAFGNYSEKIWGLPGSELSAKLAKQKLTTLSLTKLILSTLGLLSKEEADQLSLSKENLYDAYPKYGMGTFFDSVADEIKKEGASIELSSLIGRLNINPESHLIEEIEYSVGGDKKVARIDCVISTIPLPALYKTLPKNGTFGEHDRAQRIRYRSLCVIYLVLKRDYFSDAHWIYLLDERLSSNRLSEQKNLTPCVCPPGQTMVCLDITCDFEDFYWKANDEWLINLAMKDLDIMGVHPTTILDAFVIRAKDVYPIYTLGFEDEMSLIIRDLSRCPNLFSVGRHGLLLNNDMHDSMEMGFLVSDHIEGNGDSGGWYEEISHYVRKRLEGTKKDPVKFVK